MAGQLLAALWALRLLATSSGTPPEPTELRLKKVPARLVDGELESLREHLVTARARGGDRWAAVVEVYREIPDLFPAPKLPGTTMGPGEQQLFAGAYEARLRSYRAKFGKLFPGE